MAAGGYYFNQPAPYVKPEDEYSDDDDDNTEATYLCPACPATIVSLYNVSWTISQKPKVKIIQCLFKFFIVICLILILQFFS